MALIGLVGKSVLDEADAIQIKAMQETCNRAENIRIKFNWSMMRERDGSYSSDFCFYENGQLVGYAPLDGFGTSFEVTAAVLPEYRNRGIFRNLYAAALKEARRCQAKELLLVSYPGSADGSAVVRHLGLPYKSSEYRMEATVETIPPLPESRLGLEPVDAINVAALSHLLTISFGDMDWNVPGTLLRELEKPDKRYFLAKWDNLVIGQIGVIAPDQNVYIQAVGIAPEWRKRGYGRRLLAATMRMLLAEGRTHFALDVATENRQALSLYQSVGFHETTAYDYYAVPL
ncbi:MAG: family N-acetyltransferase [Chthonomonadaceae bacterium]|nr:family N-acetyltransferase [Chthonomonadaceae bacterium]